MASQKVIQKNFNAFRGQDLRSSDLTRSLNNAITFQNAYLTKEISATKRKGGKILANSGQYLGLHSYTYSDSSGVTQRELLSLSDNLYRRKSSTLTITYTGASTNARFYLLLNPDSGEFEASIYEGDTLIATGALGTGLEATPVTVNDLCATIDALTDYACVLSGTSTIPAAFLPIINGDSIPISPSTYTITFWEWEARNSTTTNPFAAYYANRGADTFEHASILNMNNVAYIATGTEYLHKYDGQTVYRAGVPQPTTPSVALGAGAGVNAGTHSWAATYLQVDNQGNVTEGLLSSPFTFTVIAGTEVATVTYANILAGSGFNTNSGVFNNAGTETDTNLDVDNGSGGAHTLKVGDKAYFLTNLGVPTTRNITAVTASTITIDGAAVTVANNTPVSNNLKIPIYRTKVGGNQYYLVKEIPNDSFNTVTTYTDTALDNTLTTEYLLPDKTYDLLTTKPKYLTAHQGLLAVAGAPTEPNIVRYSDILGGPEVFPQDSNFFVVPTTLEGGITGIASAQDHLIVGKHYSLFSVSGDLDANAIRVEKIAEGAIGFACHNSIKDIKGGIVFLAATGFYSIANGFEISEIGAGINKQFTDTVYSSASRYQLRRAFATNFEMQEKYFCFVPTESGSGTGRFANSSSKVFVFDYYNAAWGDYTGLNMGGGIAIHNNELFWQSKRDDSTLTVTGNLWREHNTGVEYDYADHATAIDWIVAPQWDTAGEPSVDKLFLYLKVYNLLNDPIGQRFDLAVTSQINFIYQDHTSLTMEFGQSTSALGWGLFPWGDTWGSPSTATSTKKLRNGKAFSIRFVFSNNVLHEKPIISGWEYTISQPYAREIRKGE